VNLKVGDRVIVTAPNYWSGQLQDRIGKIQKVRCFKGLTEYLTIFAYTEKQVMPVWLEEKEFRKLTPLEELL